MNRNVNTPSAAHSANCSPHNTGLCLQPSDLLPGDVLLFRPRKPNLIQQKIEAATNSPYSHAAIYLGNELVADSTPLKGVAKRSLETATGNSLCVAVLRSQAVFSAEREHRLNGFVDTVIGRRKFYDFITAINFEKNRDANLITQLEYIRENYGKTTSVEDFAKQSFICSAFVVACYSVVGIIGETAQAAYKPNDFAPGHLGKDPTFGWLLGYLVPRDGSIPDDDPLLVTATLWRDVQSL